MTGAPSFLELRDLEPGPDEFLEAVQSGLSASPKTLSCKFFYDTEGSHLFERICGLAEYYPTRTECALLAERAGEIAALVGPRAGLVEFGSGAGVKIRLLLGALEAPAAYVPVDISRQHLIEASRSLAADFPDLPIAPVCADYTKPFALTMPAGAMPRRPVAFFPGSTIGNFDRLEALSFLKRVAKLLGPGGMMLVGVDLVKDRSILEAAYNDAEGVTARFNRNLLYRINRELGGNFEPQAFAHHAFWNELEGRIEMHLVSRQAQTVTIGDRLFSFAAGESIHTENSYKYDPETFARLACRAGFRSLAVWMDEARLFSIHMLEVP